MQRPGEPSPRSLARIAGLFALLEALTSGFGQVVVPRFLVVPANAAATVGNIVGHRRLFELSILAGIVGAGCHVVWTLLFYELFKPVRRMLALLAAFVGIVAIALQSLASVLQAAPLVALEGGASPGALDAGRLNALVLVFARIDARAFDVYLAFFGFWCVLTGYLIFHSTFLPRVLGALEALAGLCWMTFLWLPAAHFLAPYNQVVAAVGELSLMFWLLAVGVDEGRWRQKALTARE